MARNSTQNFLKSLKSYSIPTWNELPNLDLYMDQVITLMEEYLSVYKRPTDKLITPSMINNYVKLGVVPKPYKKRYGRIHLAYLIMVCTLKQILPIAEIQALLPLTLSEAEAEQAFNAFQAEQRRIFEQVTAEVSHSQLATSEKENTTYIDFFQKAVEVVLTGNIYKILSELIADQADHFKN